MKRNLQALCLLVTMLAALGCVVFIKPALATIPQVEHGMELVIAQDTDGVMLRDFVTTTGEPVKAATTATVRWEKGGLRVSFVCEDKQVVALPGRERDDGDAWRDDAVDVWLDIGHTHNYASRWVHVMLTAAGSVLDEAGPASFWSSGEPSSGDLDYTAQGLKTSVAQNEHGWTAEIYLPWEDIGAKPEPGDAWGFNLNRANQPDEEYQCWSPTKGPFITIHRWGHIIFANTKKEQDMGSAKYQADHKRLIENATKLLNYANEVAQGQGWTTGQAHEPVSDAETEFRAKMEQRKSEMLSRRAPVTHPALLTKENFELAKRNIATTDWGKEWFANLTQRAEHVLAQPDGYIESMIPELTPTSPYGFTCPACVGRLSQPGAGAYAFDWDYRKPDVIRCKACGHELPDARFPEERKLVCPRRAQSFTFLKSPEERANPEDNSGRHAWFWVRNPTFVSIEGMVRERKIIFMLSAAKDLALMYRLKGDTRYATAAVAILKRLTSVYRSWLYHDYWGTFADCDPLYAAWHYNKLPVVWKRHPAIAAYLGAGFESRWTGQGNDEWPDKGRMTTTFFGSGIIHPSADTWLLRPIIFAYDLICDAKDENGRPLLDETVRIKLERDVIIEHLFMGEPYVGGPGMANEIGNKAPYVYMPMAMAGKALGLPEFAHVALMGLENICEKAFVFDGFSTESPAYGEMFIHHAIWIPEYLDGFRWPDGFAARKGTVSVFKDHPLFASMLNALLQATRADGRYLPLSDTSVVASPNPYIFEICRNRLPDSFKGVLPTFYRAQKTAGGSIAPSEYALMHLEADAVAEDTGLPLKETFYPGWRTAVLRHGNGPNASLLTFAMNLVERAHRHSDNLAVFYAANGQDILAEQGYVGDSVMLGWGASSASHNLVLVDDQEQRFAGKPPRSTNLRLMATTPVASIAEGDAAVYGQCSIYRRRVVLLKGPGSQTLACDIFRVAGGNKHEYRFFSNIAASDSDDGAMKFDGLKLKAPPLVSYGASVKKEDIFGLRDTLVAVNTPQAWRAVWSEKGGAYRFHALAGAGRVEASHGPGQQTYTQVGRRVRYLGLVNEGTNVSSVFVGLHEPAMPEGGWAVKEAQRLPLPAAAGADAVAIKIKTTWGDYLLLNDFEQKTEIAGVEFAGSFGLIFTAPDGKRSLMTCRATDCKADKLGFNNAPDAWRGKIARHDAHGIYPASARPSGWPKAASGANAYLLVGSQGDFTGYPVKKIGSDYIEVADYPMQEFAEFEMPVMQLLGE